jgi:DNA primase large subunit
LRLAFCRSEENRAWFAKYETSLFKLRMETEDRSGLMAFLRRSNLLNATISREERHTLLPELKILHQNPEETQFFKVPFEHVLQLVSRRAVVVRDGFAYVPEHENPVLITNAFREHLIAALEATARALPRMDEDDR